MDSILPLSNIVPLVALHIVVGTHTGFLNFVFPSTLDQKYRQIMAGFGDWYLWRQDRDWHKHLL
jgi:hypothetical protein